MSETYAPAPYIPMIAPDPTSSPSNGGMRSRIDRAKRVLSVTFPNGTKVPEVVVGAGGKEEEMKRERLRRATDGVIYWQKEVARLRKVENGLTDTPSKKRR